MNTDNHDAIHKLILEKVNAVHTEVKEICRDVKKQNGRVRKLENKYNYFIGALSVLGIIGSILWKIWK